MKTGLPRHLIMTYSRSASVHPIYTLYPKTYVLALRNGRKVKLNLSLSEDVCGGRHVDEEIYARIC